MLHPHVVSALRAGFLIAKQAQRVWNLWARGLMSKADVTKSGNDASAHLS
jgi:hypothetical protein